MKAILTGLALLLSTSIFANHPEVKLPEPIYEGDKITTASGAKIKWGNYKFYQIESEGMQWDFYTYTPYCNGELEHPFLTFDKLKDELVVFDYNGKEIDRMYGEDTVNLGFLVMYQQENYKCPI
jgi:hypothetical protein